MIRAVAAIDDKQGLANDHGIPWQGKVPLDVTHFRKLTAHHNVLMGFRTYQEFAKPMDVLHNYVLTKDDKPLRPGFEPIRDLKAFLENPPEDLWVIGGAKLFELSLNYIEEMHITHIEGDFHCTKFFPDFEDDFLLVEEGETMEQSGISFRFCTYVRKA